MTTVSICLPTRGRSAQVEKRVNKLLRQEIPDGVSLIIVLAICKDDDATQEAATRLVYKTAKNKNIIAVLRDAGETAVEGWNKAYYYSAGSDWFVLAADDIEWRSGWLAEALAVAAETNAEVIGLNDGHTDLEQYAPHYMVSRQFAIMYLGDVLVPPIYQSWWFDREVCEKADALGLYAPAYDAHAEHFHPDWQKAQLDETYEQAWPLHDVDRAVYLERKKTGFPLDYVEVV